MYFLFAILFIAFIVALIIGIVVKWQIFWFFMKIIGLLALFGIILGIIF